MNGEECKKRGCTPLAKIVAHAECGVDPKIMGTGPIPAVLKTVCVKQFIISAKSNFNTIYNVPIVTFRI